MSFHFFFSEESRESVKARGYTFHSGKEEEEEEEEEDCAKKERERERRRESKQNDNNVRLVVLSVDAATVQKHSQSDETVSVEEQGRFVQRNPTGVSGKSHARGRERRRKEASDRHRRVGPIESVQRVGREEQRVAGETERTVDGGESVMRFFYVCLCDGSSSRVSSQ